jgi:hypothetical protein
MELPVASISSEEVRYRALTQLEKLRQKERQSKTIDSEVGTPQCARIDFPPF